MDNNERSVIISGKLAEAVRAVKIATADRGDAASDTKETERARLEVLAQELQPVFDDVPAHDPQWDFALSSGLEPRLWIDATAHVMMGRDRRTYRFVRDTRLGRVVVAESTNSTKIADAVTLYIAERIVERSRLMEGEVISFREPAKSQPEIQEKEVPASVEALPISGKAETTSGFSWFMFGALVACIVLFALFHERLERILFQ